jgi:hypothetical protein
MWAALTVLVVRPVALLGHRAVTSETLDALANTSYNLRGFPHGASPNIMRYGGNSSSKVRAVSISAVAKPSVNRS